MSKPEKVNDFIAINAGEHIASLLIFLSWLTLIVTIGMLIIIFYALSTPESTSLTVKDPPIFLIAISGLIGFLNMQAIGRILQHLIALRHMPRYGNQTSNTSNMPIFN